MLISSWLIHSFRRKRRIGLSLKGDPLYGPQEIVQGRGEYVMRMVRSSDGKDVVSSCTVTMLEAPKLDDIYWFPSIAGSLADDSTDDGAGRTPISISGASNKLGSQHIWAIAFG
jgi:hypothetical protein